MSKPVVVTATANELPVLKPLSTAEDFRKLREIEEFLKEHSVSILSSIESKGAHVGRFKGIALDADGFPIIECDIDELSCTG